MFSKPPQRVNMRLSSLIKVVLFTVIISIIIVVAVGVAGEVSYAHKTGKPSLVKSLLLEKSWPFMNQHVKQINNQLAWQPSESAISPYSATVYGYAGAHSVSVGDTFSVYLSTSPGERSQQGHLEVFRMGADGRELVFSSVAFNVYFQEAMFSAATIGTTWDVSLSGIHTAGWRSGYYTIDFVTTSGERVDDVAYIIATNPNRDGDILVKLPTNNYQAYNDWGGISFYRNHWLGKQNRSRGQMISFDRPGRSLFYEYAESYVDWLENYAETTGLKIDYISNFDLYSQPAVLDQYPLLIVLGHDEYVTKEEYDATWSRIHEKGGNTFFIGANMYYWQVRYADVNREGESTPFAGRQMIAFKSTQDPIRYRTKSPEEWITALYRENSRKPEASLMGAAYCEMCWMPRGEYQPLYVQDTSLPFFYDTGYQPGDSLGNIIGYEWDNVNSDNKCDTHG